MKKNHEILNSTKNFVKLHDSKLCIDEAGFLRVKIHQSAAGHDLRGSFSTMTALQAPSEPDDCEIENCRNMLSRSLQEGLTIIPYNSGLVRCKNDLDELSTDRAIVAGMGLERDGSGLMRNITLIRSFGINVNADKCSLSSDDLENGTNPGLDINIFVPEAGNTRALRWGVLNCHEYTHPDYIRALLEHKVEVLVVVTYNAATRLYWEYAFSDIHRMFCYIIIVNIAELGGSGVFAPFRRIGGEDRAIFTKGGQLFGSRGQGNFEVEMSLDIEELRQLREEFSRSGFEAEIQYQKRGSRVIPVVPSEHFMRTVDRGSGPPPINGVRDIPHAWNAKQIRIAVAQLEHIGMGSYLSTKYRIRNAPQRVIFEERLDAHLQELEVRCRLKGPAQSGSFLDFLVFPEVFIPRTYLGKLQALSEKLGSTIVAGVDYPNEDERDNANECAVIRPWKAPIFYRKITRSQYDAVDETESRRMALQRGNELFRFVNSQGDGFGVLVCYDFSHIDLVWELNLRDRIESLDLIIVVAHNPHGDLYRSCCIADSHRYYQYIAMCNVSNYGGSGVFGPLRTRGEPQVLVDAGQGVETIAIAEIDISALRQARKTDDRGLIEGRFMRKSGLFQGRLDFRSPGII